MKITIITVAYNAEATIGDALKSVRDQDYPYVEHIVVDGASMDGTLDIIQGFDHAQWTSEPDRGIYDAMNKGLSIATGDVIGFLNADDVLAHPGVVSRIAGIFAEGDLDACFADLQFVRDGRVVRHYSSSRFRPQRLRFGWMPAHPTTYVRKAFFDKVGGFSLDYEIAADYEWMVRAFAVHGARWRYVPEVWVRMRMGGVSTRGMYSRWVLNREIVRACCDNGIDTNLALVLTKFPRKLLELWRR